jgi:hypothetical protein
MISCVSLDSHSNVSFDRQSASCISGAKVTAQRVRGVHTSALPQFESIGWMSAFSRVHTGALSSAALKASSSQVAFPPAAGRRGIYRCQGTVWTSSTFLGCLCELSGGEFPGQHMTARCQPCVLCDAAMCRNSILAVLGSSAPGGQTFSGHAAEWCCPHHHPIATHSPQRYIDSCLKGTMERSETACIHLHACWRNCKHPTFLELLSPATLSSLAP